MQELERNCDAVEELCRSKYAEAAQTSQALVDLQQKFTSVYSWLVQIGEPILNQHNDPGTTMHSAKDFLDVHEQVHDDIKVSCLTPLFVDRL